MRILVVEDDDRIADFLMRGLRAEGRTCVRAQDGREALALGVDDTIEFIILDLMLPDIHGRDVCQELRARKINTPILMLTALTDIDDVIGGLRMGADDYMTKPFNFDELLARMDALTRRGNHAQSESDMQLKVADIVFDQDAMRVSAAGNLIELTVKEMAILDLLMSNPNKLFSRERILNNVWGMGMDPLTNVVDVHIGHLRKKLSANNSVAIIETVRGLGYRLVSTTCMEANG